MQYPARVFGIALLGIWLAIPAHATVFDLQATLDGMQEVPDSGSIATGIAQLTYDDNPTAPTLTVDVSVIGGIELADLSGSLPFHIHIAPAGVNGSIILAVGTNASWQENPPQAGGGIVLNYQMDLSSAAIQTTTGLDPFGSFACPDFATCLDTFETALLSEGSYLNLHTLANMGGEIRGQIVPEPGAAPLAAASLTSLAALRRARRATPRR